MKKLRVKYERKLEQETFVHVAKTTGFFQPGVVYTFVEFPNDYLIRQALCVHVRTVKREDLTPEISFLDANCDLEIYQEILDNRGLAIDQLLTVVTFASVHNSRNHYLTKNVISSEPAKTESTIISNPFIQAEMEFKPNS